MKVNGYPVEHCEFEEKIRAHQTELLTSVRTMEKNNIESSKEFITKIQSSIEEMYDTLEKEVESRDYLESQHPIFKESLDNFEEKLTETQDEGAVLKEAYHFAAEDLDKFENIEKNYEELRASENHLITQQENKSEIGRASCRERVYI